jgi:hypothetical protein
MTLMLTLLLRIYGSVAQLNSASDFGSEGWGFESLRGHKVQSESEKRERNTLTLFFLKTHFLAHYFSHSLNPHYSWNSYYKAKLTANYGNAINF